MHAMRRYGYYLVTCLGWKAPQAVKKSITTVQMVQFALLNIQVNSHIVNWLGPTLKCWWQCTFASGIMLDAMFIHLPLIHDHQQGPAALANGTILTALHV